MPFFFFPSCIICKAEILCPLFPFPHASSGRQNPMSSISLPPWIRWQADSHALYFPSPMHQVADKIPCPLFPFPYASCDRQNPMPSISLPLCIRWQAKSHALYFPSPIHASLHVADKIPSVSQSVHISLGKIPCPQGPPVSQYIYHHACMDHTRTMYVCMDVSHTLCTCPKHKRQMTHNSANFYLYCLYCGGMPDDDSLWFILMHSTATHDMVRIGQYA